MATAHPEHGTRSSRAWHRKLPFPFGDHPWWIDGTTRVPDDREDNPQLWREGVINIFDNKGFDGQVCLVSALGFLTDSYALFATNVILPLLAFLYWPDRTDRRPELYINVATLTGSVVGQLLFGWLTDKLGRRKLYGLELVLVIFATLGMAQASSGIYNNMDILSWIIFYRFFLGMGIGAEYPLSAVITAEFASKKYRAQIMATVFLMQPLGQILAAAVGWGTLTGLMRSRGLQQLPDRGTGFDRLSVHEQDLILSTLDSVWRWVIGAGCIPALFAILWRFSIPESPRYTMDVGDDPRQALAATKCQHPNVRLIESTHTSSEGRDDLIHPVKASSSPVRLPQLETESAPTFREFFIGQGNIRYLAATSICWFILDFCFYALGINSPRPLAALWASHVPDITVTSVLPTPTATVTIPVTQAVTLNGSVYHVMTSLMAVAPPATTTVTNIVAATDSNFTAPDYLNIWDPTGNMFHELSNNAMFYICTISIPSLAGSGLLILLIDYVPRKRWLVGTFLLLSFCFAILGGVLVASEFGSADWADVVLYALCQFIFNIGQNPLTYIVRLTHALPHIKVDTDDIELLQIPAEIFPTRFRATSHGISAACGKLDAIVITILTDETALGTHPHALDCLLGAFSIPLALGAYVAGVWIPELQTAREGPRNALLLWRPSKSLEQLSRGWIYANNTDETIDPETRLPPGENQRLGLFKKPGDLWNSVRHGGRRRVLGAETAEGAKTAEGAGPEDIELRTVLARRDSN
ncbi:major facilitator superfamily domain-containing protein [Penicillium sp. IBT 16267x]|nr:major facilitator superfamily domain-containing protein [Penicillium sp. IBT 16267x]